METTAAQLAAQDQSEAKEREFDRKSVFLARVVLVVAAMIGAYCLFAGLGVAAAAPWSPLGQ